MSHIEKLATEARLVGVKVIDFDVILDGIGVDIDNQRKVLKRWGIKEDKTLAAMLNKEEQLRNLMAEWLVSTDLPLSKSYNIKIFVEEAAQ